MNSLSDVDTPDRRFRAGDQEVWVVALTDRYTNLLWSVARGMRLSRADAADAVQTTWLRLVERVDIARELPSPSDAHPSFRECVRPGRPVE